jgi:AraC-like DNA-binding protein
MERRQHGSRERGGPTPGAVDSTPAARLLLGAGRALYVGPAPETRLHAHHAIQLCIGLEESLCLRTERGPWRHVRGAIVPSDVSHELRGTASRAALLYVDPDAAEARALLGRFPQRDIAPLPPPALRAVRRALSTQVLNGTCVESVLASLAGSDARAPARDARIRRALEVLQGAPRRRIALGVIAEAVGLSPGRLGHLFRQEVGLPVRRYLLWLRVGDAVEEIARGVSLTAAAHAAGFSDSAHLTRTFRRMFGIAPSGLRLVRFERL